MRALVTDSSWLVCYEPRPDALVRLFCFPHGGGGPHSFRPWASQIPNHVEVFAISLPGRGVRQQEPNIRDIKLLTSEITMALEPYLDKPYALFGHSIGALLCYEVAQKLKQSQSLRPLHVFISSNAAPHRAKVEVGEATYQLLDGELVKIISELGLIPADAMEYEDLVQLLLPPIRADFEISETYQFVETTPLDVNLSVMAGNNDKTLTQDLDSWKNYTSKNFSLKTFDGGHFYTQTQENEVLSYLGETLKVDLQKFPSSVMFGPKEPYPHDKCLHQLFSEQAAKTPDVLAVVDIHQQLTFRELDKKTDLLARYLRYKGAAVNKPVGIYMEKCVEYVIAYLAILKAGAGYLPIETAYPCRLLENTVRLAKPIAMLTKRKFCNNLPDEVNSFCLNDDWENVINQLQLQLLKDTDEVHHPDMPAYFIMTSGTTGVPKGIRCPHRGSINSYYWRYNHYPYGGVEREAGNAFFVWEIIRPILQGSTAYVIPDDVIYDPRRLIDYLSEHKINRVLLTPSLLEQILHTPKLSMKEKVPDLKIIYLSGEVVNKSLRNKFVNKVPGVRLLNVYSVSECHDVSIYDLADVDEALIHRDCPVGKPMSNVNVYILDDELNPVPMGCKGEIFVAGDSLALDYLNLPEKTAERFLKDHISNNGGRMFRTGDGGKMLLNGHLEITGRIQFMIKLRGYSIVPEAVAAAISEHPGIHTAIVHPELNEKTEQPEFLVGYFIGNGTIPNEPLVKQLRSFLRDRVPHYAIPSYFVPLDALPIDKEMGPKVNLKKLPKFNKSETKIKSRSSPKSEIELKIVDAWKEVLRTEPLDLTDNFFDLGGHSLLAIPMVERVSDMLGIRVSVVDIFEHPTVESLAEFVGHMAGPQDMQSNYVVNKRKAMVGASEIAIIGMSCRFPKANNTEEFWTLLSNAGCAIHQFTEDELRHIGIPESVFKAPNYVKASAILDDVDQFDFGFWGISEKEAKLIDPQHRLFLQCAWEALENAGYAPQQAGDRTGIFAGTYLPSYLLHYLKGGGLVNLTDPTNFLMTETGNDKDYLTLRASSLLNCNGPSLAIQASCSTSLAAVATACQFLLSNQCDMAIAGASSIRFPQAGYEYQEGLKLSPDGQCRVFDAEANGTILGDGIGILVMKRLEDAITDGDNIHAVIKGFAINNDGNGKGGYVQSQVRVIAEAQEMANVTPDTISYEESHSTGTFIGDPIEVRALTQVFRKSTDKKQFCCLGSVKPNIGHCIIAAGMAGLFKVILSFKHSQIPPTLNFNQPNPNMLLEESPFFINNKINDWKVELGQKRRAGISCFGIGGTNCHVIMEEPPKKLREKNKSNEVLRSQYLLTLSGKSPASVYDGKVKLLEFMKKIVINSNENLNLKDIAYTLHVGREQFKYRIAVACDGIASAIQSLQTAKVVVRPQKQDRNLKTVFMFSGHGSQYMQMGLSIYKTEARYRHYFDQCATMLQDDFKIDVQSVVFTNQANDEMTDKLNKAYQLQPAIFSVEYALAKTLIDWGVQPDGLMGHSVGKYTAACLAGIFDLKGALSLVVTCAYAVEEEAIFGNMLSVNMSEENAKIFAQKNKGIWLSAVNSSTDIVFSGHVESIEKAENELSKKRIMCQRFNARQAFHCPMMSDALEKLLEKAKEVTPMKPQIPVMSNLTGMWLTDDEALDPSYWSTQMRNPVRFATNVDNVLKEGPECMIEVGPSCTLSTLVSRYLQGTPAAQQPIILSTMPCPRETEQSDSFLYRTLAQLWSSGIDIDWDSFHKGEALSRIPLPTYSFAKQRCWPDNTLTVGLTTQLEQPNIKLPLSERFYIPLFARLTSKPEINGVKFIPTNWVLFMESEGPAKELSELIAEKLADAGNIVQRVYRRTPNAANNKFLTLRPDDHIEYDKLFKYLAENKQYPENILYLWSLTDGENFDSSQQINIYYHVLYLCKALANHSTGGLNLWILTQRMIQVNDETVNPIMSTVFGPAIVLSQENPQISCRILDVQVSEKNITALGQQILNECQNSDSHNLVALRGRNRWVERFDEIELTQELGKQGSALLRQRGLYIITGCLGRIGMIMASWLTKLGCRVIVTTQRRFPSKEHWTELENDSKTPEGLPNILKAFSDMEGSGGYVDVVQLDMGCLRDVIHFLSNTIDKYGKINGIFHAAGLSELMCLEEQLSCDASEKEFKPKVYGVLNLHQALSSVSDDMLPEFVVLFSSLASVLGGCGMMACAAADRFMDAFAQTVANDPITWVSINWDDRQYEYTKERTSAYEKTVKDLAMSPEEVKDSLERILAVAADHSQILVSTRPLKPRVQHWLHQRYMDGTNHQEKSSNCT